MSNMVKNIQKADNFILKKNIRNLIEEKGISQKSLAESIGMSQPNMNKRLSMSSDTNRFTLDQVSLIADYFDVSVDDLLGREIKPKLSGVQEICAFIVELFETHQIRYNIFEKNETSLMPNYKSVNEYPSLESTPKKVLYKTLYFHNYYYAQDAKDEDGFHELSSIIDSAGNAMPSNIKINDFLDHFIDAFEKYETGDYSKEVYQTLLNAYLEAAGK